MCLYNYTSTVQCKATIGSNAASPLPIPPLIVPRSFSIPSSSQRAMALHVARHLESPQVPGKAEEVASPPLTPISLSNLKPVSNVSEVASQSSPIRAHEARLSWVKKQGEVKHKRIPLEMKKVGDLVNETAFRKLVVVVQLARRRVDPIGPCIALWRYNYTDTQRGREG
ncbi:hypothetical protein FF1_001674 [Malus domestica]